MRQLTLNVPADPYDPKSAPWWPTRRPETDDPVLLETRRVFLRSRAYDNGTEIFLRELAQQGSIEPTAVADVRAGNGNQAKSPWLREVLLPQSYFGLNQMLAFSQIQELMPEEYRGLRNERETHLGEIAKLFGIEGVNRQLQFRLGKLVRFASVGFLTALPARRGYEMLIELGPAGRAFFTKVYVPIINHMPLYDKR
ncbi:hypothetical protein ACWGS9_30665 [Bradyrhizobium sp. Arg314]